MDTNRPGKARILLTGGHGGTTGLAVVEAINKRLPGAKLYWIGSKSAISGSKATSLEHKVYPGLKVNYFTIRAGKLQTKFTRYTIPLIVMIPFGFIEAFFLIFKIMPDVTLSLGGYSSLPVVFWSWVFRIPVIIHEQTMVFGRASKATAYFAKKIALGHKESLNFFPKDKTVITGNPIRASILKVPSAASHRPPFTLLIMGGSRGSEFINENISKIIPELVKEFNVIHLTGEREFEKYKNLAYPRYKAFSFISPDAMASMYAKSDIIISRSGANSVSEIIAVKRPAILIPLPRTFMSEQVKNAVFAKHLDIATVMYEPEVNEKSLLLQIKKIAKDYSRITSKFKGIISPDIDAADKLTDLIIDAL